MVTENDVEQTLLLHAVNLLKVVTFDVKTGSEVTGMEILSFFFVNLHSMVFKGFGCCWYF
jgi:hypothetical protein